MSALVTLALLASAPLVRDVPGARAQSAAALGNEVRAALCGPARA